MIDIFPRLLLLIREEARMKLIERFRYPWGFVGSLAFLVLVYGALLGLEFMLDDAAAPSQNLDDGRELFVGLLFWIVIAGSATRIAEMFGSRYDDGIIELMMLSRIPFRYLIGLKVVQTVVFTIVFLAMTLVPFALIQKTEVSFLAHIIPIAFVTELAATGLGLAIGGMTLHLKKIGPIAGLVYAGTALAIVFASTRPAFVPWLPIVPIFGPVHVLMVDQPEIELWLWVLMTVSSLITFVIGAAIVNRFLRQARKKGTIFLS